MNRFRELRKSKHLTQAELIDQYNARYNRTYSIPALSLFENGHRLPELAALQDFADFFGVSVDYLLGKDTNMFNPPADYYNDPEVGKLAEALRDNPELKAYLYAGRDLSKDTLLNVIELVKNIKKAQGLTN